MPTMYFIKTIYKQIENCREIKNYLISIKKDFLSEELYNTKIKEIDDEIKRLQDKIKDYK